MSVSLPLDLVILVPGKDDRETFGGLLSARHESLNIRPIRYEIHVHTRRDPGCFREAPAVLRPFQQRAKHALVIFDYEGSGQEFRPVPEIESDLRKRLTESGWGDRAEALVMQPELEIWVWSDSPKVDSVLGWEGRNPRLRDWLAQKDFWPKGQAKPLRPKECLQVALREVRVQQSAAIYRQLAEQVSLTRCQDQLFHQFQRLMYSWFPRKRDR